jgi:predicted dienelactone hydrolase
MTMRHDRHRRLALLSLVGVIGATSRESPPTFRLPAPTGRFGVATTSWYVIDSARAETFAPPRTLRMIEVIAWYPTSQTGNERRAHAPYLRESYAEAQAFGTMVRRPGVFDSVAVVETHSYLDRPVAADSSTYPVLLFSHGFTAPSSAYTALLEDLASNGYVVLSIVHPYESVATRLQFGQIVTMLDSTGTPRRGLVDTFSEWADEDSTLARVTRAADDAEKLSILRGYFAGLTNTRAVVDRWVRDAKIVLDKLPALPATSIGAEVVRRVDLARIGVFGHSMGGVAAGQFCIEDRRCHAGLNLDGSPQSGTMIDETMPQPFLMVYSGRPGRLGANDVLYGRAASAYYRVDVDSTRHLDFSDMPFWGGPLSGPGAHGSITPERAVELTRLIVREYFDQELRGKTSALLAGTSRVPGIQARRVR